MHIVAVMPIKLNNERLPGKNTKFLGNKPVLQYELDNLIATGLLSEIYVYCSSKQIISYLPEKVSFLERSPKLDLPTSNFTQIFDSFMQVVDADIYVYAHATAPYVSVKTMTNCINAVVSGDYDSAFCASKIQDYLWKNNKPLNFDATNLPRSQDLNPIFRETSGVYVFTKDVFKKLRRRVGEKPFIAEVSLKEAVDINTPDDFKLAEMLLNIEL